MTIPIFDRSWGRYLAPTAVDVSDAEWLALQQLRGRSYGGSSHILRDDFALGGALSVGYSPPVGELSAEVSRIQETSIDVYKDFAFITREFNQDNDPLSWRYALLRGLPHQAQRIYGSAWHTTDRRATTILNLLGHHSTRGKMRQDDVVFSCRLDRSPSRESRVVRSSTPFNTNAHGLGGASTITWQGFEVSGFHVTAVDATGVPSSVAAFNNVDLVVCMSLRLYIGGIESMADLLDEQRNPPDIPDSSGPPADGPDDRESRIIPEAEPPFIWSTTDLTLPPILNPRFWS